VRLRVFVFALVSLSILPAFSGQVPLTVKEISLMLRTGYSSDAVLKELSVRHFADAIDASNQTLLQHSGASPALIDALRNGSFSLSPEKATAAQQRIAELDRRQQAEGERLRFNTLYRDQLTQSRSGGVIKAPDSAHNTVRDLVKDDLVSCQHGSLSHFDDASLESKKLIGLYFSAHWCGPCRKFTPALVDYYNRVAPQHPEFEVIFVSSDKSQPAMEAYMREANMPWPAIDFQKIAGKAEVNKYAGRGIPCLVVIDETGKVVSNSYQGSTYVGPQKVLADLDGIFARGAVAQAH